MPTQNRGLQISSGKYIYLAAADDITFPGFFSLAVEMLSKFPQAGLYCGDSIVMDGVTELLGV